MGVLIALLIIFLAVCSSILYRAGGLDKTTPYFIPVWMRQSFVRDWLCPLCFGILFVPHSWFQLAMWSCYYGFSGLAISSYFEWKGKHNFWISGFRVGLAGLFLAWGLAWYWLLLRAFVVAIIWGGLNWFLNSRTVKHADDIEEHVRGFVLI